LSEPVLQAANEQAAEVESPPLTPPPVAKPTSPPPFPPLAAESTGEVLWWRGACVRNTTVLKGVIILWRNQVAFLPPRDAWGTVGDDAGSALGVSPDWLHTHSDPLRLVTDLWDGHPNDFEECLLRFARQVGGVVWSIREVEVQWDGRGLMGVSEAVVFFRGKVELRGYAPAKPALRQLLAGWPARIPPLRGDLLVAGLIAALPFVAAVGLSIAYVMAEDLPWWPAAAAGSLAGLPFVAVSVKAAVLWWRRRWRSHQGEAPAG
jgi:hypothetical protein